MSCKLTHQLLNNPKHIVSKEKVEEWNEKMKMILGIVLLDNLSIQNTYPVLLKSPSRRDKFLRLMINHTEFYLTINHGAIDFVKSFLHKNPKYELCSLNVMLDINDTSFMKYTIKNHSDMFEHKDSIGIFLYQLFISFICHDTGKDYKKVSQNQISHFLGLNRNNVQLYKILKQLYTSSTYFLFQEQNPNSLFRDYIENILGDLSKDLSKYFMDGEETEKFLNTL
jgi:hypothetical protein